MADVGARTTAEVVAKLEMEAEAGAVEGGEALTGRLASCSPTSPGPGEGRIDLTHEPTVIMVAGVNGTGKTTTIGKLAWHLQRELGQDGRARRRRHVPRRRRRAARRVGAARRLRDRHRPGGLRPGLGRLRGGPAGPRARGRRGHRRHRRPPAHAGRT